jgi:hypothetical protein
MFMVVSIRIIQCPEVTMRDAEHTLTHNTFFIFQQTVVCNELACRVLMLQTVTKLHPLFEELSEI